MKKITKVWRTAFLLLLFGIVLMNTAAAASEIHMSDFTASVSNPVTGVVVV